MYHALMILGFAIMTALALAELTAGFVGMEFFVGRIWALLAVVLTLLLRLPLIMVVGAYFGTTIVWGWPWPVALLFAALGLVFLIPGAYTFFLPKNFLIFTRRPASKRTRSFIKARGREAKSPLPTKALTYALEILGVIALFTPMGPGGFLDRNVAKVTASPASSVVGESTGPQDSLSLLPATEFPVDADPGHSSDRTVRSVNPDSTRVNQPSPPPPFSKMTKPLNMLDAVMGNDVEGLAEFVREGRDINIRVRGTTPLIAAVKAGNVRMVEWLLIKGADPTQPDDAGRDAYLYAQARNDPDVLRLLSGAGTSTTDGVRRWTHSAGVWRKD